MVQTLSRILHVFLLKTVNGFKSVTIFTKDCILDTQQDAEIAFESKFCLKVQLEADLILSDTFLTKPSRTQLAPKPKHQLLGLIMS